MSRLRRGRRRRGRRGGRRSRRRRRGRHLIMKHQLKKKKNLLNPI